jgi:virginiamycin B lyase
MRRPSALLIALVLLAGCGGGGGSHAPVPTVPQTTVKGSGTVQFAIDVPASTTQAKGRKAQYVSPATQSIAVIAAGTTTNINVAGGSPGCATNYGQPSIVETPVNDQPRGVVKGPDGNIWFVEDGGESFGTIAPGGVYTDHFFGYFQNGIIVGPDGALWTTSPYNDLLGHITTSASLTYFTGFPEDMQYLAIAADNTVWGTAYTQGPPNTVYHIATNGTWLSSDTITTQGATTMPALGPDGAMYVTENNGVSAGWIARIAKSGSVWTLTNEFPLPTWPYAITNGPDNALWITDYAGNVYRMTTSGTITNTYAVSPGASVAIHTLPDGALWIAEYGANKIARITTTGTLNEFTIPHPATNPYDVAAGSDGVYFSEQNANIIGRLNFPVSCTATASLPAGSGTVTVTAYDANGGAGGGGHVLSTQTLPVTITANTTTTVNFVLNGVVKSLIVGNGILPNPCASSGSVPLNVEALDASGNAIIGPGNYSDAAGDPLTITLTTTDTSGNSTLTNGVITAPGGSSPALNWSTGFQNFQTIGATVSGGTIAGSIATDVLGGCS